MAISGRIRIETRRQDHTTTVEIPEAGLVPVLDEDSFRAAELAELLEKTRAIAPTLDVVRVEVEYRDKETGEYPDWEISGDAVQIDFRTLPPTITTLPPYAEVTP